MTLEELIEHVPDPVNLAKFIGQSPDPVRIWDNGTLDITIGEDKSLHDYIKTFACPVCGSSIDPDIDSSPNIKGTFKRCPDCEQRYFFHQMVPFGGTPSKST